MNTQSPVAYEGVASVKPEVLRARYEGGATIEELVADTRLSHGTIVKCLRKARTIMRTSWETRQMRRDPQQVEARRHLAAHLRNLYEQEGATLAELAAAGVGSQRAARRLLIEAGGAPRTPWQTRKIRTAAEAAVRRKLAFDLRVKYEAGAAVPDLARECKYSAGTVYRLLRVAGTTMRPQHHHGPARRTRKLR